MQRASLIYDDDEALLKNFIIKLIVVQHKPPCKHFFLYSLF